MAGTRRYTDYMPLADVQRAPRNPKGHNTELIANSISRFGIVESPAIDERTGRLVAGHGRLDDWITRKAAGEQPPDGIDIDPDTGDWLVPVQRGWASRSDADAEAYLVISNSSSQMGGWDDEGLAQLLADLRDQDPTLLDLTGFDDQFITDNWDGDSNPWDHANPTGVADPDDVPEPPAEPVTQPGDVWLLGPHRLLCGSATDPTDVDRALNGAAPAVVYTDPPYGISVVQRSNRMSKGGEQGQGLRTADGRLIPSTKFRPVIGDETTEVVATTFALLQGRYPHAAQAWWGANHYSFDAGLPNASRWLVWNKDNSTTDFADCELAWTNMPGPVRMFTHMWNGMLRASERSARVHPNQKPVALAVWALGLLDKAGGKLVFDGFGGSGSTMLAAEQTGRPSVTIELDPGYCDVICRRYQEATGIIPVREADGEKISFMDGTDG